MNIEFTLGNIITICSIGVGFFLHYIAFSNRLSKFEGYTKAKIEDIEKDVQSLWDHHKDCTRDQKDHMMMHGKK